MTFLEPLASRYSPVPAATLYLPEYVMFGPPVGHNVPEISNETVSRCRLRNVSTVECESAKQPDNRVDREPEPRVLNHPCAQHRAADWDAFNRLDAPIGMPRYWGCVELSDVVLRCRSARRSTLSGIANYVPFLVARIAEFTTTPISAAFFIISMFAQEMRR